jgi:succinyl-CoA synthetase alpha subunit
MSILMDENTRVIVQGITGREGLYHTRNMKAAGTNIVGGVTPGKGGHTVEGVPVFDTVSQAKAATDANASCIFVPPAGAADAIMEAASAGIELIVCITEGIPVIDMTRAMLFVREHGARLVGPNCPGICTPGYGKIGIIPYQIFTPGSVGFISRSGTLTYEVVSLLTEAGIGQSSCIGIGGDPIIGSTFVDYLKLFEQDPGTKAVVMCGEIGGSDEEDAAEFIKTQMTKPVVAFISGRTAPPGKRMGHAGAIISGNTGTAQGKVAALQAAKVPVADTIFDIPGLVKKVL